jgi:hypothetical protein
LKYALKIAPVHVSPAIQVNATKSILAHGFARARCPDCTAEFLVAFSCKGRGVDWAKVALDFLSFIL